MHASLSDGGRADLASSSSPADRARAATGHATTAEPYPLAGLAEATLVARPPQPTLGAADVWRRTVCDPIGTGVNAREPAKGRHLLSLGDRGMGRRTPIDLVLTVACWAVATALLVLRLTRVIDWPW